MTGRFGFHAADPVVEEDVSAVPLPRSLWSALDSEAKEHGLTRGEAVAQLISESYVNGASTASTPEPRRRGKRRS